MNTAWRASPRPATLGHKRIAWAALLIWLLVAVGCRPVQEQSRWEATQATTEAQPIASEGEVVRGGEFNKFFPKTQDPFSLTYLQEKEGFAEAALEFEGDEVATLSISDTANNPSARDKFTNSNKDLEGYPLAAVGSKGSAILIADRFQVQVRSTADDFAESDRTTWLLEFDLDGLAALAE
ncbi:MAG: hypothetical protein IT329_04810 [Caldilineaceae bacterium]|nr:hypothetical protein [Caldilineaceae bacterium]